MSRIPKDVCVPNLKWIEKHSTNCKRCGHLVDERDCVPEDDGDICQECYQRALVNAERYLSAADVVDLCGKHNVGIEFLRELYRECEKLREIIESGSVQDLDNYLLREC